jgi:putative membrane protein
MGTHSDKTDAAAVLLGFLLLAWLGNALSLAVANWIFDGVEIGDLWSLILGAAVLGIANTVVKPVLELLALPFVIITLGLAVIAINAAMLALAEWVAPDFSIDGFWTYVGATIVVGIVNSVLHALFRQLATRPVVA